MTFDFDAELFEWDARDDASWVFVQLPIEVADEIRDLAPSVGGFGSVKVAVACGSSEWRTSVFPDKGSGSYVLPLKKAVRRAQSLEPGDVGQFSLSLVVA